MRKTVVAILTLTFIVGCGVSEAEHIRVVNELEKTKAEISQLKGEIEKLKLNVNTLSEDSTAKTSSKWEYKFLKISSKKSKEKINEYGKEGWELITVFLDQSKLIFAFKRLLY